MKCKLKFVLLAVGFLGLAQKSHAWIFQEVPDKAVEVHYRLDVAANITTNTIVIDLSDTTNWPHKETGELNLDSVRLNIDKVAASTVTVKLGVVTYVDSSTGCVTWFTLLSSSQNVSNTNVYSFTNYMPTFIKCRVNPGTSAGANGTTPYIFSNDTTLGSTIFQNDVVLPTPAGNAAPGTGDIVMQVSQAGTATVVILDLVYHSNQR